MTKEQEKAIEFIKYYMKQYFYEDISIVDDFKFEDAIKTVLNLIQTQKEESEKKKAEYSDLKLKYEQGLLLHKHHLIELEKKDKIIDEMAKQLYILGFCKEIKCKECTAKEFKECIKQYFERKIENV